MFAHSLTLFWTHLEASSCHIVIPQILFRIIFPSLLSPYGGLYVPLPPPEQQHCAVSSHGVPVASRSIWRQIPHALSAPLHEALGAIPTGTPPGRHGKHLRGVRGVRLIGVRGILYAKIKYILTPISTYLSLLSAYTPSLLFGDAAHSCQQGLTRAARSWQMS